jgi:hypothetical protein
MNQEDFLEAIDKQYKELWYIIDDLLNYKFTYKDKEKTVLEFSEDFSIKKDEKEKIIMSSLYEFK